MVVRRLEVVYLAFMSTDVSGSYEVGWPNWQEKYRLGLPGIVLAF